MCALSYDYRLHDLPLGYMINIAGLSGLIVNLFAGVISRKIGDMNCLFIGIFLEGVRFLVYSLVT